MRAVFFDGVDKIYVLWTVKGLPALLHLPVFLFFGGLAIFLFNINPRGVQLRDVVDWACTKGSIRNIDRTCSTRCP